MRLLARFLVGLVALLGLGVAAAAAAAFLLYQSIVHDLPDLHGIEDYRPPLTSVVFDREGRPIGEFFDERRRLVTLDEIPRHVILAFVASEDDSFFRHSGIDVRSILRAAWADLTAGEIVQGGSTITQQTVKSLLLTPERRFDRKFKEMILARRLEQHLSKDEILALYLNQIYFGSGAWGIGEAARTYFGKPVGALAVGEGALLAGLPKAPSRFSPYQNPESAEERRRYVLGRMHALGFLDDAAHQHELEHPPALSAPPETAHYRTAAWFTEEVRRTLFERLGGDAVLRGGLRIETTLDLPLQAEAERALRAGLEALDRRQGWQGPLRRVPRARLEEEIARLGVENGLAADTLPESGRSVVGVVTTLDVAHGRARVALGPGTFGEVELADVAWARRRDPSREAVLRSRIDQVFAVGDVARLRVLPPPEAEEGDPAATPDAAAPRAPRLALEQVPAVEGALVAVDLASEEVTALVGGYDPGRSQFDRAVQARRQPGSAFKPFIYAAALQKGYTAVTTVYDSQVVYTDPTTGEVWMPANYDGRFRGPVPLREALARSLNNATIRLLFDVGVRRVVDLARALGIRSPLAPYPSLALGTSPVTLLELTTAYGVFPAGGRRVTPVFIRRVLDREGQVILSGVALHEPAPPDAEGRAPVPDPAAEEGPEQILDPRHAFLVADLMRATVEHPGGTARRARALGRALAGKTGTTNDQGDAWFVGFSPSLVAGVWVGFDERQVLGKGETGGRAALPIWIEFMKTALEQRPVEDFPVPEGVSYARVDARTGKLAEGIESGSYFQSFLEGSEPTESAAEAADEADARRLLRGDF
jgi:penicillin-binding protein 1A